MLQDKAPQCGLTKTNKKAIMTNTKLELMSDAMGISMATLLDAMNDNEDAMARVVATTNRDATDDARMLSQKLNDI